MDKHEAIEMICFMFVIIGHDYYIFVTSSAWNIPLIFQLDKYGLFVDVI
jgi:hypothetical protein